MMMVPGNSSPNSSQCSNVPMTGTLMVIPPSGDASQSPKAGRRGGYDRKPLNIDLPRRRTSATPEPFASGRTAAPSQTIREAGGTNIFDDLNDSWTTTSWEAAAQRDPQAIVIVDYGAGPENSVPAKIEQLRRHPLIAGTTALREDNLIALPYAALVEGPRNPQAVVIVADFLRSI